MSDVRCEHGRLHAHTRTHAQDPSSWVRTRTHRHTRVVDARAPSGRESSVGGVRYGAVVLVDERTGRAEAFVGAAAAAGTASVDGGGGTREHVHTHTYTRPRTHTSTHMHTYTHKSARGAPPQRIAPPTHAQPANRSPRYDHVYHHPANQRLSRALPAVDLFSFLLYLPTAYTLVAVDRRTRRVFPRHAYRYLYILLYYYRHYICYNYNNKILYIILLSSRCRYRLL